MKVLLTGATGQLGGLVTEALLKKINPSDIAVSVRNPEKAAHLAALGIEVRQGDFDQPESLVSAFANIDRLLIISADGDNATRIRQHGHAIQAAKAAGVGHIVYTSAANATESSLDLAEVHRFSEKAILETGIPYTILRNNWYLENEMGSIQGAVSGAPWVTSAGEGKVGWSLRSDYAEAAAAVLAEEGHVNQIYELSNTPISQSDLAAVVGKVLGKSVQVLHVDDAAYADGLKGAGLPEFVVELLTGIQRAIRENALDVVSNDFERVLGRPATPIAEAVAKLLK